MDLEPMRGTAPHPRAYGLWHHHMNLHPDCPAPQTQLVPKGSWALRRPRPQELPPFLSRSLPQLVPWPWFALDAAAVLLSPLP